MPSVTNDKQIRYFNPLSRLQTVAIEAQQRDGQVERPRGGSHVGEHPGRGVQAVILAFEGLGARVPQRFGRAEGCEARGRGCHRSGRRRCWIRIPASTGSPQERWAPAAGA